MKTFFRILDRITPEDLIEMEDLNKVITVGDHPWLWDLLLEGARRRYG